MRVSVSKPFPSPEELKEVVKHNFSGKYAAELFGLGKGKTLFVSESDFVAVQITRVENQIEIKGVSKPTLGNFFALLLGFFVGITYFVFYSDRRKLEREIGVFLKAEYN